MGKQPGETKASMLLSLSIDGSLDGFPTCIPARSRCCSCCLLPWLSLSTAAALTRLVAAAASPVRAHHPLLLPLLAAVCFPRARPSPFCGARGATICGRASALRGQRSMDSAYSLSFLFFFFSACLVCIAWVLLRCRLPASGSLVLPRTASESPSPPPPPPSS